MTNEENEYQFNIKLAQLYGVDEAIIIDKFILWTKENKKNGSNYYKFKYWINNTLDSFQKIFPFYTINQIRRILKSLIDKKVMMTGNFNINKYDRTLWYCVIDEDIKNIIYNNKEKL